MPIRYLFCDEIDEYPGDVEGQGDPISLAEKRTTTFARRKVLLVSTPTLKGLSRIEREYAASDRRKYFVPCPHCQHFDWIRWENIRWENDDPKTAMLACAACGSLIEEHHKNAMLAAGEWRPTASGDGVTAGFHLSSLYSPLGWKSWAQCVSEFLGAKEDPFRLKTWINTVLGETWEERGDSADPETILARAERYAAEVPNGVGVLVAAVDVQGDRLEAQVKGYGRGEESWLIAYSQFHGDPSREAVWHELDGFLRQPFVHQSGRKVRIECVAIDSGGHHSEQVYRFCKARVGNRVFAVRGGSERGKPVVARPTRNNRYRTPLFTLCVDTAKEMILSRLRIGTPGPGYCHLPEWTEAEYVEQLTSEKAVRKYLRGRGTVRDWVKTRERNEALDLEVYCLAALYILGPQLVKSLPERAAKLAVPVSRTVASDDRESEMAAYQDRRVAAMRARRGGWINSWRDGRGTGRWIDGWR
jgi:phage terminase large subunit GpA-like protein